MNWSYLKSAFIDLCEKVYDTIINSVIWHLVKEKYASLRFTYRKIIHISLIIFVCGCFLFYPLSFLFSSWQNIQTFKDKKQLIQQINIMSSALKSQSVLPSPQSGRLANFVEHRMSFWPIMKNQITSVKEISSVKDAKLTKLNMAGDFLLPKPKLIVVKMNHLNLKESVQFGRRLERLSSHFKLLGLQVKENQKKENYFDVSYTVGFFVYSDKVKVVR